MTFVALWRSSLMTFVALWCFSVMMFVVIWRLSVMPFVALWFLSFMTYLSVSLRTFVTGPKYSIQCLCFNMFHLKFTNEDKLRRNTTFISGVLFSFRVQLLKVKSGKLFPCFFDKEGLVSNVPYRRSCTQSLTSLLSTRQQDPLKRITCIFSWWTNLRLPQQRQGVISGGSPS